MYEDILLDRPCGKLFANFPVLDLLLHETPGSYRPSGMDSDQNKLIFPSFVSRTEQCNTKISRLVAITKNAFRSLKKILRNRVWS